MSLPKTPTFDRSNTKAGARSLADLLAFVDAAQQQRAESAGVGDAGGQSGTANGAAPAVDLMALLARCLGNIDLIVRVLTRFRNTGSADIDHLGQAIENSDLDAVVEISHRLKGAASNVSAAGLQRIAAEMEQLARSLNQTDLPDAMDQLRREWNEFERYADAFAPAVGAAAPAPARPKY